MNLRDLRSALEISQSRLSRLCGVSRFKICTCELGSGILNADEQDRIRKALQAEADRLRSISSHLEFGQPAHEAGCAEPVQVRRSRSTEKR